MAKRLNPRHQESVRTKIRASYLVNLLQNNVARKLKTELTAGQIQSAKILLDKAIANAPQRTEISGPEGAPLAPPNVYVSFNAPDAED